jgi:hypothetical protein
MIVDDAAVQVISAARSEWIHPFTGLSPAQFRRLVRLVAQRGGDVIADGRPDRQWALDLPDRVLLVAAYWRTNLTMHQIGPLFGANTRLVVALGDPQPGNRNDTIVYRSSGINQGLSTCDSGVAKPAAG